MSRRSQFASLMPRGVARCALVAAMLVCTGSLSLLCAQDNASGQEAASSTGLAGPGSLPPAPAPSGLASGAGSAPSAPVRGLESGNAGFGKSESPNDAPSRAVGGSTRTWSRSMLDPFQPGPNFGNFSGADAGPTGGVGTGGFGAVRQGSRSFHPGSVCGMGERQSGAGPLFADGGMKSGSLQPFGAAPLGVPSLNQLLRGGYSLPLSAPSSSLRFAYQDAPRPGGTLGELARPSATMMFSTSDLGNGMFLSAGTGYGHTTGGEPAAGLASNASAGGKRSGPSLALKLSF